MSESSVIDDLAKDVASRIASSPIQSRPFPHIIVEQILPQDLYEAVLVAFPPRSELVPVDYPGTGFGRRSRRYHDFGYAYMKFREASGVLGLLHAVFASDDFGRSLLDKFSRPLPDGSVPIPREKWKYFAEEAHDYSTVFDLQVDLPGYCIAPHPDVPSKIVTFQLFLTEDDAIADYGTLLCEPKVSRAAVPHRSVPARLAGRLLRRLRRDDSFFRRAERSFLAPVYRRFERSRLGLRLGVGATVNWFPWEWFDVVKVARALPNQLLAFAPNDRSFHAVNFDVPADSPVQERRVLRGFIMSGREPQNFIRPHGSPPSWRDPEATDEVFSR
jgi:hypothetical protein